MVGDAEFTDPVSYPGWLWWVAIVPPLVVLAWYLGVWLWAHGRFAPRRSVAPISPREAALARLDEIATEFAAGEISLREAHQRISEIVRSYVSAVGTVDARVLDLEQLRVTGPEGVADLVALVYPPEFAPGDEGSPAERLVPAMAKARAVVSGSSGTDGPAGDSHD